MGGVATLRPSIGSGEGGKPTWPISGLNATRKQKRCTTLDRRRAHHHFRCSPPLATPSLMMTRSTPVNIVLAWFTTLHWTSLNCCCWLYFWCVCDVNTVRPLVSLILWFGYAEQQLVSVCVFLISVLPIVRTNRRLKNVSFKSSGTFCVDNT